jgi:hypothetical protein
LAALPPTVTLDSDGSMSRRISWPAALRTVTRGAFPPAVIEKARWAVTNRTFVEDVRPLTVTSPILALDAGGKAPRVTVRNAAGQEIRLGIDPSESKVTVGGKAAKVSDLAVGRSCAVDYLGDGGIALRIACD